MAFAFKENNTTVLCERISNSFLKTVSAFANFNSGVIYFGIADDDSVVGIDDVNKKLFEISNAINEAIVPVPEFELVKHEIGDKTIIELDIYSGDNTPYTYKSKAYMRSGITTIQCDSYMLDKLLHKHMNLRYEELPYKGSILEFEALETSLKNTIGIDELSLDVMRTLGLYVDGSYNNAAALLADTNSCSSSGIRIIRYGDTENILLNTASVEKQSLLNQYSAAIEFFDKWYKSYEEVSGFYRVERVYIPREAFRLAIINAFCFRDYSMNEYIKIFAYRDRIEIVYPGMNDSVSEKSRVPSLQNESIALVLRRLKLIDKCDTGFNSIKAAYSNFYENPDFIIQSNSTRVVLPKIDYTLVGNGDKQ